MKFNITNFFFLLSIIFNITLFNNTIFATANSNTSSSSSQYLDMYQMGNYRGCVKYFEKNGIVNVDNNALEIFAECLFQIKKYQQSAEILFNLISKTNQSKIRAVQRLIDIVKLTASVSVMEKFTAFLLKNPHFLNLSKNLQYMCLENNRIDLFYKLYQKYPVYLSKQRWSIVISQTTEKEFKDILSKASVRNVNRSIYQAKYYLSHKNTKKALKILDEVLQQTSNADAIKLKAEILWNRKEKNEALAVLNRLKRWGSNGYRNIAQFIFNHGNPQSAIAVVDEATSRGYQIYDLKVFYTMSQGKFQEAAALLEIYKQEKKLYSFHYNRLVKDFERLGNAKEYYLGLKMAQKKYPKLCKKSIYKLLEFGSQQQLLKEMKSCSEISNLVFYSQLLYRLDGKKKYQFLQSLLKNKKSLSDHERLLLAKTQIHLSQKDLGEAIVQLNLLETQGNRAYRAQATYLLAVALMKSGKFYIAAKKFKKVSYKDKKHFYYWCLIYDENWDELNLALRNVRYESNLTLKDKKFFYAVWNLGQNQLKEAEKLLESYLDDAGSYGNQSVYLLFLFKYFNAKPGLKQLMLTAMQYPYKINDVFLDQSKNIKLSECSEYMVFKSYWLLRYQMATGKSITSQLKTLLTNPNIGLLKEEIRYMDLQARSKEKESVKKYLMNFPESPFRVFIKP